MHLKACKLIHRSYLSFHYWQSISPYPPTFGAELYLAKLSEVNLGLVWPPPKRQEILNNLHAKVDGGSAVLVCPLSLPAKRKTLCWRLYPRILAGWQAWANSLSKQHNSVSGKGLASRCVTGLPGFVWRCRCYGLRSTNLRYENSYSVLKSCVSTRVSFLWGSSWSQFLKLQFAEFFALYSFVLSHLPILVQVRKSERRADT